MYKLPKEIKTKKDFSKAMDHAIAIELTTIPCYLSTYYSIQRAKDQDALYAEMFGLVKDKKLAQELTMDILLYAGKAAGLIMSVVIEEMLHLALSSNVKQASSAPPDLMAAGKALTYPTSLFADPKEFKINRAPLSLEQLTVFLKIESPNHFQKDPTIGDFYDLLINYVQNNEIDWRLTSKGHPQLVPSQPYYSQNSINTVHYDKKHKPQFPNADNSGGLVEVCDRKSAIDAMNEIIHQGEGYQGGDKLQFGKDGMPVPLPLNKKGEVIFNPKDYDDKGKQELSHFAKFYELYSLGYHQEQKFAQLKKKHKDLQGFFTYFTEKQDVNPVGADYATGSSVELDLQSQLGNAIYTYILLMIETCYYKDVPTQYEVFMMGIHKSMIWLMSQFGYDCPKQRYTKVVNGKPVVYAGSVTFEYYPFENDKTKRPKEQIVALAAALKSNNPKYNWLFDSPEYLLALPDVTLDHQVNKIPLTAPKV